MSSNAASSSENERQRIAAERPLIEQARISIAAGDVVADDEVDAWLDHMVESVQPMPIPERGRGRRNDRV